MRWRVRRSPGRLREPPGGDEDTVTKETDESHTDRAGQRNFDGRAHAWMRLRGLSLL